MHWILDWAPEEVHPGVGTLLWSMYHTGKINSYNFKLLSSSIGESTSE